MKLHTSEFLWEDIVAQKIDKYHYLEFILDALKSWERLLLRNTTQRLYITGEKKSFDEKFNIWLNEFVIEQEYFEGQIWPGMYSRTWK